MADLTNLQPAVADAWAAFDETWPLVQATEDPVLIAAYTNLHHKTRTAFDVACDTFEVEASALVPQGRSGPDNKPD